jgi:thiamine biosynthesis lipoprotein
MIYIVKRFSLGLVLVFACLILASCEKSSQQFVRESAFVMDTFVDIMVLYNDDSRGRLEGEHRAIAREAINATREMEQIFSMHIEGTDIWRINNAGGEFVEVSPHVVRLLEDSQYYFDLTGGRFDVTIGAVTALWDFDGMGDGTLPSHSEVAAVLHTVGTGFEIDGNRVRLNHPQAMLDLGAIAKGYAADYAADVLRAAGVPGIVNISGDSVMVGIRPDAEPWVVGITMPFAPVLSNIAVGYLEVFDSAVVSSGIDQRSFFRNNIFYHHILDVRTGFPVETNIVTVSIITPTGGVRGEGLTTAIFVLGAQAGLELVEALDDAEAIVLMEDMSVYTTSGVGSPAMNRPIVFRDTIWD